MLLWIDSSTDHVNDLSGIIEHASSGAPLPANEVRVPDCGIEVSEPLIVIPKLPVDASVLHPVHTSEATTESLLWLWEESRR